MKTSLLALALATLLAPKAHAIHAYHNDWCHVADTFPQNSAYTVRANQDWAEATPKSAEEGSDASITGSVVVKAGDFAQGDEFQVQKTKITHAKFSKYNDGCWIGTEGYYDAVLVILKTSPKAEAMGLKVGAQIPVHCDKEDIDPDGPSC
jgi:hypothetical protein